MVKKYINFVKHRLNAQIFEKMSECFILPYTFRDPILYHFLTIKKLILNKIKSYKVLQ